MVDFGIGVVSGATPLPYCGLLPPATQEYVSPEAWRFLGENVGEPVRYESTVADDLWALGVTFYWLLTNHLPFGTRHSDAMVKSILADTPKAPHECNPRVPQALSAVCMRMLLVAHPGLAMRQVNVFRQQTRPVAYYQQVAEEAEAEARQCRVELEQLRAERNSPDGLRGALASGLVSGEGASRSRACRRASPGTKETPSFHTESTATAPSGGWRWRCG